MSEPALRLLALWKSRCRGGRLPAEGDITPAEMTAWLAWLVLLDVLSDPPDFRYRRAGTLITSSTGHDMSGKRLSEMPVPAEMLAMFMAEHRAAVETRSPRHDVHRPVNPLRGDTVAFERLLLPLSEHVEKVTALLGMRRGIV